MSMENDNVQRMGEISTNIREAIRKALPTPSGQFLTVMIPGKVVNFDDYKTDGNDLVLPLKTELNQAILCDDMPAMAPIQMGPTGRSVSRSYAATISKLVPAGTTVGIDDGEGMTSEQKRYKKAMEVLSKEVPGKNGLSLVELYTQKQSTYTKAVAEKTKAFQAALKQAQDDPSNRTVAEAREDYDRWLQENAKTYRNYVQAAYMDWVITGKKEEVEYWFSVVDQDSALARVEQSKEVMRLAVVQDSDGSGEFQTVKLEPSDWANKCIAKMNIGQQQTRTVEWYTWEISRLEKTNQMLTVLRQFPPEFAPNVNKLSDVEVKKVKDDLDEAIKNCFQTEQAYKATKPTTDKTDEATKHAREEAIKNRNDAKAKLVEKQAAYDKLQHNEAADAHKETQNKLYKSMTQDGNFVATQVESNKQLIKDYTKSRDSLLTGGNAGNTMINELAVDMEIPRALPDPEAQSTAPAAPGVKVEPKPKKSLADYFTPITVEVSATSESDRTKTTSSNMSFGASASYGWLSASASMEHSDSHSEAMKQLASSNVKISFECMRVDITRPWLRAELFYDEDLKPGPDVRISPGFGKLQQLMEDKSRQATDELNRWMAFSMYPVSFIVACNVVLEISGSTSKLESFMNSSSTSGSASVQYGPFAAASGSYSTSSADAGSTCKTTASGCRIEIKSPQIIAWVSQMVPALPRIDSRAAPA
ncbi:hypothetical protein FRC07_006524 [Ceratobasidium sp. 392]|nr:hypothetical protein FRC07_006524 [Ceratobasidium sp. 392]